MSGKSKKVNPRRQPATKADVERAKRSAVAKAIRQTQAIVFSALADKDGWDADQLLKLWWEVKDLSDSIAQGYVKIPDLMDTLRQVYGVTVYPILHAVSHTSRARRTKYVKVGVDDEKS